MSMSACASVSVSATVYLGVCVCARVRVHESPSAHAFAGHAHGPVARAHLAPVKTRISRDTYTDHGTLQILLTLFACAVACARLRVDASAR